MSGSNLIRQGNINQVEINNATLSLPGTIAASGTYTSPLLSGYGLGHVTIAAQIDHTGTLSLQKYLDNLGSVVAGAAVTAALASGTINAIDHVSTIAFQTFQFKIINSSGGTATPSNVLALVSLN